MKMVPMNKTRLLEEGSVRERLAEELEERLELACWINQVCGVNAPVPVE